MLNYKFLALFTVHLLIFSTTTTIIIIIIIIITNALSWQGFQVNTQNDEKEGVM